MNDFPVLLVLDFFQARSTRDRTEEALTAIVAHVSTTYALSNDTQKMVLADAMAQAQQRGLLAT